MSSATANAGTHHVRFGEWLLARNVLDSPQIASALTEQRRGGGRLGEVLNRLKLLKEAEITSALADYLGIERWSSDRISDVSMDVAQLLPERLARRLRLVALGISDSAVQVAMVDPLDVVARDTVGQFFGRDVKAVIATEREIRDAIEAVYHGSHAQEQRIRNLVGDIAYSAEPDTQAPGGESVDTPDIEGELAADKAPVVQFVNLVLNQAVKSRASDIHIEPQEQSMAIRMRVDGMLREMIAPPRAMQKAVVARVKILSGMDIAERRLPQDGRMKIKAPGRQIDVRVSAIPTIYGEKIVLRILDKDAVNHDLDSLGFESHLLADFKAAISRPHGIVVVTGPTGSGKSTTLYSALNYLRDPRKNITTIEDPVEYRLHGINQIQIKPGIGLTFARCLRSILRQDPDIILVGEVRDSETMEIAMQASLTGHLVLTTFHTNDAPSALSRFTYMGLERYLLASTVNLVTAQRLVRRICEHCKSSVELDDEVRATFRAVDEPLPEGPFFMGKGCAACGGSGYSGRLPIFEFLPLDTEVRALVSHGAGEQEIRSAARRKGYGSLMRSALARFGQGQTTVDEILRVTTVEKDDSRDGRAAP